MPSDDLKGDRLRRRRQANKARRRKAADDGGLNPRKRNPQNPKRYSKTKMDRESERALEVERRNEP